MRLKPTVLATAVPAVLAVAGAVAMALLLSDGCGVKVSARLPKPGEEGPRKARRVLPPDFKPVNARGTLTRSDGVVDPEDAKMPGAWPCFRGPNRDGVGPEKVPLARKWPEGGPARLWEVEVGEGHAGAAVLAGRVYVMDYDREHERDAVRCLSLADGREIWRYSYPVTVKRNHGMSRTVPAVTARYVVTLGPKCHVTCLDSVTGELRWAIDLVKQYGARVPDWYAAQCPLIDSGSDKENGRAIIAPAGDEVLLMALDLATGDPVWKTPNPYEWQMTHASVAPMTFAGRRTYIYAGMTGVVGVSADDGAVLWEDVSWKASMARVPTPVVVGDDRVLLTSGYGAGSAMLRLSLRHDKDGKIESEILWRLKPATFGSDQHTPVYYQGHIYGVRPRGELVCLDPNPPAGGGGKVVWTSGREQRFFKGYGDWLVAGGMLYVMESGSTKNPKGVLRLVEATPAGFRLLDEAKVLDGHDAWGPMALAGGRLIVRDLTRMVCLDVSAR